MAQKIDTLTPDQIASMPAWAERWTALGLCTAPADFEKAVKASLELYRSTNRPGPKVVVLGGSPPAAINGGELMASRIHADRKRNMECVLDDGPWNNIKLHVGDRNTGAQWVWSDTNDWDRLKEIEQTVDSAKYKGTSLTFSVWSSTRDEVADKISENADYDTIQLVEMAVRERVRADVGHVGRAVGDGLSNRVKQRVGWGSRKSRQAMLGWGRGAQSRVGWHAFVSFFRDVCGWEHECLKAFAHDETLALSCGWTWWHPDVIAISDRPHLLRRDDAGRLHNATGPAIEYRDGWGLCCWHGYVLPATHEWIVRERDKLSTRKIGAERNVELRRIMLEAFGLDRYLHERGAKEIAVDTCQERPRRLLQLTVSGERVRVVEVENGSLEPDGTRRKFVLTACRHPITNALPKTPHEAIAWSYGRPADEYTESVRT